MVQKLFFIGLLLLTMQSFAQGTWEESGEQVVGQVIDGFFGEEIVMSGDGQIMAVSDPFRFTIDDPNPVTIFAREGSEWVESAQILNSDPNGIFDGDLFGSAMSMSDDGTILAIGVPRSSDIGSSGEGRVVVFRNEQGSWVQVGEDIQNTIGGRVFGESVDISADGSIVAIGNADAGIVQVFQNNNDNWEQLGQNLGTGSPNDFYGQALSISDDGNLLAIGAVEAFTGGPGRVEIYNNDNGQWVQLGNTISGSTTGGQFGQTVELSGDGSTVVIAAISPNLNSIIYVEVYGNENGQWIQQGNTLENCGGCLVAEYGYDVSITEDGSLIAISDPSAIESDGTNIFETVEIYNLNNGTLTLMQEITITTDFFDGGVRFGSAVAFNNDGNILAIGASSRRVNDDFVGSVDTYENTSILSIEDNNLQSEIAIYPNPFVNNINIDFKENQPSLKLEVVDIQGRIIEELNFKDQSKVEVNLERVAQGSYFIKLSDNRGGFATYKVLKN